MSISTRRLTAALAAGVLAATGTVAAGSPATAHTKVVNLKVVNHCSQLLTVTVNKHRNKPSTTSTGLMSRGSTAHYTVVAGSFVRTSTPGSKVKATRAAPGITVRHCQPPKKAS